MKSTMKSAFAFIAVAMMIMVAVVPMVSVFTESSDAVSGTPTVDPAMKDTDMVTIDVKVYSKGSTLAEDTGYGVNVAYKAGNGTYALTFSVTNGEATVMIAEEEVSEVTMTYVDDEGVAVPGYGKATLNDLTSGKYSAKIVNGLASKTFTLKFQNSDNTLYDDLDDFGVISGKFDVYESKTAKTAYSKNNVIDEKGTATVYYPLTATAADICIKITNFSVKTTLGSDAVTVSKDFIALEDDTNDVKVNECLVTAGTSISGASLTVTKLTATKTVEDVASTVTFKWINNELVGDDAIATVAVKPDELTLTGAKISIKAGTTELKDRTIDINNSGTAYSVTYSPEEADNAFYGSVMMNIGDYLFNEKGTLSATFTAGTSTKTITANVDDEGYFFEFGTGCTAPATAVSFKTDSIAKMDVETALTEITFGKALSIKLDNKDYAAVDGKIVVGDGTDLAAVGKIMDVTGSVTFGDLMVAFDNSHNSVFSFAAPKGASIKFEFNDSAKYTGDIYTVAGTDSENLEITMSTKTISIDITDALGENITTGVTANLAYEYDGAYVDVPEYIASAFKYNDVTKTYESTVRGDLNEVLEMLELYAYVYDGYVVDLSTLYVDISNVDYTFEVKEFVDGGVYMADEAAYTVSLYKSNGITPITGTAGSAYSVNTATAYKNSLGSIVYYDITPVSAETDGKYIVDASIVGYTKADITSVPVDVLILKTETSIDGIFDAYYILDADAEGKIAITASVDSFTGKLVKNDGVTPVAGVKVEMYNSSTPVSKEAAYTQNDGSFTLYSDSKIVEESTLKFTAGEALGYTFNDSDAVFNATTGEKETVFEVKTSTFKVSFVDADDAKIALTVNPAITDGTFASKAGNVATFKASWDGTEELTITGESNRTFAKYTPTAAELAAGAFTVKSNQSTYTFSVVDANGKAIDNTKGVFSGNLYKYNGDIPVKDEALTIAADGTFKLVLPLVADDGKAVTYGYKVTSSNGYAFADVAKITEAINVVKSTSALKTVVLQDAAGEDLATAASEDNKVTVYGGVTDVTTKVADGKFSFIATDGVEYTYTITDVKVGEQAYTFDAKIADVDGVVKAKEETITGTVTDAAGKFVLDKKVTVSAFASTGAVAIASGVQGVEEKYYTIVAEKAKIAYYTVTAESGSEYTFAKSYAAPEIKANETKLLITLTTVNGDSEDIGAVDVTYTDGTEKTKELVDKYYIIVDTTKVSEYSMTVGGNTYTSKTGAFVDYVADYSGSVGVPNATGSVSYVIYKGSDVTGRGTGTVDAGKYELNDVDTSLGDKIVVTYVNSGKTYSAVLNTAAKTTELVEVVPLDTSLIVLSGETDKITCKGVSADGKYVYLLAEKSYTKQVMGSTSTGSDGHDLAEKFKFDGWYVNGEKVSGEISYTADNTEGNIVAAYYVSDGYYETNKPVDKTGNNSSVMIIGIAAVIIALIAVVYAVIQKKQ